MPVKFRSHERVPLGIPLGTRNLPLGRQLVGKKLRLIRKVHAGLVLLVLLNVDLLMSEVLNGAIRVLEQQKISVAVREPYLFSDV